MKKCAVVIGFILIAVLAEGCGAPPKFATGYSSDDNPEIAAGKAAHDAIAALGSVPVKGLIFVVYYPAEGVDADNPAKYSPDETKERLAAETIAKIAADLERANGWASKIPKPPTRSAPKKEVSKTSGGGVKKTEKTEKKKDPNWKPKPDDKKKPSKPPAKQPAKPKAQTSEKKSLQATKSASAIPNIGLRARGMTQAGTLKQGIAVLAIGGHQVNCRSSNIPILRDRYASGRRAGRAMQEAPSLKIVFVLSEMQLCFGNDTKSGPEDFIRGMMENLPRKTILLGGNSMNVPGESGKKALTGMQFNNGVPLPGQIVTMGIGEPVRVYTNHTSEFKPVDQMVTVTGAVGNWVTRIDGIPAAEIYRKLTGMTEKESFSRDCRHGVGVVLRSGKMYVRMIRNWVNADGKDSFGNVSQLPPGSLRFDSPIVVGTQLKILYDEGTVSGILDSAKLCVRQSLNYVRKTGYQPALVLVSDCCTRDMRRCFFGGKEIDEAKAVVSVMEPDKFPLFGFYAFGQIGPIGGIYRRMNHQFQQHTFISALIATE